jgi:DNA ligase-associated metallophosphoesterase
MTELTVPVAGTDLVLFADKAVFWPAGGTLLVADPHWGKAAAFAAGGLAVPQANLAADLDRLSRLLEVTGAARLAVLGDLFHAKAGKSAAVLDAVAEWRTRRAELDVLVVRGNHDLHAGDPPADWRFTAVAEAEAGPFALRHYPDPVPGRYTLAGHVHPAVMLSGRGRQRLRLPCFFLGERVGVLPAFGGFTGTGVLRPTPRDRVFVVADGEVIGVN